MSDPERDDDVEHGVAILAMAGRFPGARDLDELWHNLAAGRESITFFTAEELEEAGLPAEVVRRPDFVKARPVIHDVELFDAAFFDVSPREAEILDPQSRLFLEHAWEALERAGYVSEAYEGWIGVFAGTSDSSYRRVYLDSRPDVVAAQGWFPIYLANDRDYFTTRVSYKLDLRGPSVNVQTACSTSLVAVHQACQALLDFHCDLALAGGACVFVPQVSGYPYEPGGITSPDGHCRPFDRDAAGSIFGSGVGVVVLKRLADALADGDTIKAVIRGSAINNDGAAKVGFTAPSIEGQAEAVAMAQSVAGVAAETITYVECHGSGTELGDPIEVAALKDVFGAATTRRGFCALGSVKSNFGHLEAAAGVAGLIKTVLALEHRLIPPTVHFREPNPRLELAGSPFFVNAEPRPWEPADGGPRRAGVSAFGMGGTNAHVVLEEAPAPPPSGPSRPWQLLALSARTPTALDAATARLADHLAEDAGDTALADVASTLQMGRRTFEHRRALVCRDRGEAVRGLRGEAPGRLLTAAPGVRGRPVAFLLPGIGEHYPGMGAGLYEHEAAFRAAIDECAALAEPHLGRDLRELLFPAGTADAPAAAGLDLRGLLGRAPRTDPAMGELTRTLHAHAAVFAVEYALARLWASWGVEPAAMIGHSLGEYVAATLAGVVSLADVLRLVATRARRIDELPGGAMLAVTLAAAEVEPRLGGGVWLSAVNGPRVTVVAGEEAAVAALAAELAAAGVVSSRLPARHAFHSPLMEPAAEAVAAGFRECALKAPEIPFVSGVSGRFITAAEATDPEYWTRHLCRPVRFADGLARLLREHEPVLLEVGPGQGLGALALQSPAAAGAAEPVVVPALRGRHERHDDQAFALTALGRLWLAGVAVDWRRLHAGEQRRRIELPTYPFERRRFWIDRDPGRRETAEEAPAPAARERHERPYLATAYAAPESELQQRIAAAWQEVLGVSPVGLHDSFFDLGGHSLLAPRLLLRLEQATEVALPVPALLGHPTVAELAELVERVRREGLDAVATARVDLAAEVTLAEEVRVTVPWDAAGAGSPRTVLVTGGTGFLGAHLVAELLAQTGARLCCLARGGDERTACERLRANLEHHRVWRPDAAERLEAVAGDLAKPLFGLSGDAFRELADRVDAVYHGGAWVNFTYPYGALAPANVGGTREALRLAASGGRARPFHFISSVAVFAPAGLAGGVGYEDAALAETAGLFSGYAETKWVGEKIVGLARERGVPAVVYRPGVIAGDSRSGVGNMSDMVWNVIKGSIELGAVCAELPTLDVAPVDYVARAIVHLSLAAASAGRAFHFSTPRPMPWSEVFDVVRAMGYPVRPIPYREWRGELVAAARAGRENALVPFLPLFPELPAAGGEAPPAAEIPTVRYDDRQAVAALAGSGIRCPPLDAALVRSYLGYFVASGFLEPP